MKKEFLKLDDCIIRISSITAVSKEDTSAYFRIYIYYGFADDYFCYKFESDQERDQVYDEICKIVECGELTD